MCLSQASMRLIITFSAILFLSISLKAQNNVGIGTATPNSDAILDLSSTTQGFLMPRLNSADTTGLKTAANEGMMFYSLDDDIILYFNGTTWDQVLPGNWARNGDDIYNINSGFVGIGLNNPSTTFEVAGGNGDVGIRLTDTDIYLGDVDGGQFGNYLYIDPEANGNFQFIGGDVGIGTNSPQHLLDVVGSEATVDGSAGAWMRLHNAVAGTGNVTTGILFDTYVNATSGTKGGIFFRRTGAFGVGDLLLSTNSASDATNIDASDAYVKMILKGDGRVGIGTVNPNTAYKTTVNSDLVGGIRLDHLYTGTSAQYGIFQNIQPNNSGTVFGNYVSYSNTGTGQRFGTFQQVFAGAGNNSAIFGTVNNVNAQGSGQAQAFRAELTGSGSGTNYGLFVFNSTNGTGTEYGIWAQGEDNNYLEGNLGLGYSTASDAYQLRVDVASTNTTTPYGIYIGNSYNGTATKYGLFAFSSSNGTGTKYGVYGRADQPSGEASPAYGLYSFLNHDGTGVSYGAYLNSSSSATTGDKYGLFTVGEDYNQMGGSLSIGSLNTATKLWVDMGTGNGANTASFSSDDTWGTAINIDALGGGGSAYQLVVAGSAHPTLTAGSFAIANAVTGNVFTIDGTTGDVSLGALDGVTTNKVGIGSVPTGSSKVYIFNNDNSFLDGLWVSHSKTSGTGYGIYLTANNSSGSTNYGIRASSGGGSGTRYGVYGSTSGTGTRYGVYCVGNGAYTGSWTNVSDQNLKRNIQEYSGALNTVMQLQPKTYEYRTDEIPHMNLSEGPQIGLIAQEVQTVLPGVVTNNAHPGPPDENGRDTEEINYLGIDYIKIVPVLTQAIKEQQALIEQLQQEIEILKNE